MIQSPPPLFNRDLWKTRRARTGRQDFSAHDFLHKRAIEDLADRVEAINRTFSNALIYGARGYRDCFSAIERIQKIHWAEPLESPTSDIVLDEEKQDLRAQHYDLIISILSLHTVNDLIGAMVQYRQALKPDGVFLGVMLGGQSLATIRTLMTQAELETVGGAAVRFHPFADVKDLGNALSRAGFTLPVTDVDKVRVAYKDPIKVINDLRKMGETGMLHDRPPPLARRSAGQFLSLLSMHDGPVEFDLIYLTGWAPHRDQPKPLKPGSAKMSLAEGLKRAKTM